MDDPARRLRGALHGRVARAGLPGCLTLLLLLPVLLVTTLVVAVGALFGGLFGGGARSRSARRRDPVLEDLVTKLALDDTFSRDEAATAGIPLDEERSVDDLLRDAEESGWIERRGDRFAVTARGRELTGASGR